jgi:hypothetical protein
VPYTDLCEQRGGRSNLIARRLSIWRFLIRRLNLKLVKTVDLDPKKSCVPEERENEKKKKKEKKRREAASTVFLCCHTPGSVTCSPIWESRVSKDLSAQRCREHCYSS